MGVSWATVDLDDDSGEGAAVSSTRAAQEASRRPANAPASGSSAAPASIPTTTPAKLEQDPELDRSTSILAARSAPSDAAVVVTAPGSVCKSEAKAEPPCIKSELAGQSSSSAAPQTTTTRGATIKFLTRAFVAAGASSELALSWSAGLEAALWSKESLPEADSDDEDAEEEEADPVETATAMRAYRAEARRLAAALKDRLVAEDVLRRLRTGELTPAGLATVPSEELLPAAKRARLMEIRAPTKEEDPSAQSALQFKDEHMACIDCEKTGGNVSWEHVVSVREGHCGKADTWGSSSNSDRIERCRARCASCLAEWLFEL